MAGAIVLSGHGVKCDDPPYFRLPKGLTMVFWTRAGREIRDSVAGNVERYPEYADLRLASQVVTRGGLCPNYWLCDATDPPLQINTPVDPQHFQVVARQGNHWRLSDLVAFTLRNVPNPADPVLVHWCACRSERRLPTWVQSLRLPTYR